MEWAKVFSFVLERVLFYREVKFSYWSPFQKRFQTLRVIGLITLTPMPTLFKLLGKVFSSVDSS